MGQESCQRTTFKYRAFLGAIAISSLRHRTRPISLRCSIAPIFPSERMAEKSAPKNPEIHLLLSASWVSFVFHIGRLQNLPRFRAQDTARCTFCDSQVVSIICSVAIKRLFFASRLSNRKHNVARRPSSVWESYWRGRTILRSRVRPSLLSPHLCARATLSPGP